jgi:hypothetical protein
MDIDRNILVAAILATAMPTPRTESGPGAHETIVSNFETILEHLYRRGSVDRIRQEAYSAAEMRAGHSDSPRKS